MPLRQKTNITRIAGVMLAALSSSAIAADGPKKAVDACHVEALRACPAPYADRQFMQCYHKHYNACLIIRRS